MRKFILSAAVAALMAGGAYAQTTTTAPEPAPAATQAAPTVKAMSDGNGHLASALIGESVYDSPAEDAKSVGKVTDLVIGPDGKVTQMVVGVGGFLGIGAKDVALDLSEAQVAERNGDRWLIVSTTKEALEAAPAFDRTPFEVPGAADATAPPATTSPAPMAPAPTETTPTQPAPADPAPATPAPADPAAPATPAPADPATPPATPAQ